MSMFTLRRSQKQSGFTLMELLIVIAVLGLLLGMLIPRLAGITDDTVDTVCDTNNKGTRYMTQMYINKYNEWPNNLTNLVDMSATEAGQFNWDLAEDKFLGTADLYMPSFQDDNVGEDEVLALEFFTRNAPGAYRLNAAEIVELRDMGITQVFNKQGADRAMQRVKLDADDTDANVVMMMGMSSADNTKAPTFNFAATYPLGNPEWIGRIMFAVNDKCDLVTEGVLQASALCPGAVLNEENFSHKEYILVLPRLQATIDRFAPTDNMDGATLYFVDSSDSAKGKVLEVVFEAQPLWNFDMSCPEGHKWPDNDEDHFVYFAGDSADGNQSVDSEGTAFTFTDGDIYTTTTTKGIY